MTDRSKQNWPDSETFDLNPTARDISISLLAEQHLLTGNLDADAFTVSLLARDISAVADETSTEVYDASIVLRGRIGGWSNLESYLRCLRAGADRMEREAQRGYAVARPKKA